MTTNNLIAASDFCVYHQVEYTFITLLHQAGLIEVNIVDHALFIPEDEIAKLEKMIRLHQQLDINVAGIEAITHLLTRIEQMQQELMQIKNQLKRYDDR